MKEDTGSLPADNGEMQTQHETRNETVEMGGENGEGETQGGRDSTPDEGSDDGTVAGDDGVDGDGDEPPMALCSPISVVPLLIPVLDAVQQMRGRPLFVIAADFIDHEVPAMVYKLRRQIIAMGALGSLDVLIHSPGGNLNECYRTARLLARYVDCWEAIVPTIAASGATLICLGSNNIVLPDFAFLGPVDPQVMSKRSGKFFFNERQSPIEAFQAMRYLRDFSVDVIESFTGYLIRQQSVAPPLALDTAVRFSAELARPLLAQIEPYDLGSFGLDSTLALRYCTAVAKPDNPVKQTQRNVPIQMLVEEYPAHEFVIDREEADALGFQVSEPESNLEDLLEDLRPVLDRVGRYVGFVPTTEGDWWWDVATAEETTGS